MSKKPLNFKADAEKLIPFLASITNSPKTNIIVAMQLRKDMFSTRDTINMNDPVAIEKERSILGSTKRVKIAIRTLKNIGLLVEKIDPKNGQTILVRNLSSEDTIQLLKRLSKNMMDTFKSYMHNPMDWPDFPIVTDGYKSMRMGTTKLRQRRVNKKNKVNEID